MYGKTSKSAHYLPRTGSYSTVPHRNGRVDVLPPEAREAEIEFQACADQVKQLKQEAQTLEQKLYTLNNAMAETLPWGEFARLEAQRESLASRLKRVQALCRVFAGRANDASDRSFERTFLSVAKSRLSSSAYQELIGDTTRLMDECGRTKRESGMCRAKAKPSALALQKRNGLELALIRSWLARQDSRMTATKAHAEKTGRDLGPFFSEDVAACRALIGLVTRMIEVDGETYS